MKKIAIIGMGYVGFPLAVLFAHKGHSVVGLDIDEKKINDIQEGKNPIVGIEPSLDDMISDVYSQGNLEATTDYALLNGIHNIIITIDTPMDKSTKGPDTAHILRVLESICEHLERESLIVIESTIPPSTSKDILIPFIEKRTSFRCDDDFYFAHFPERIAVGHILEKLATFPRVLGVSSDRTGELALDLYSSIIKGEIDVVDLTTAEFVKTAENAYRDVQIAFANELAMVAEQVGVDVYLARELINNIPYPSRDVHYPGAGVGGHCLTKDGLYLISSYDDRERSIIRRAREINDRMPIHVFELLEMGMNKTGLLKVDSIVGIFGMSFINDSGDTREAPTIRLLDRLRENDYRYIIHDFYVDQFENESIQQELDMIIPEIDLCVFMVDHSGYKGLVSRIIDTKRIKLIIDGRNLYSKEDFAGTQIEYYGIGKPIGS